MEILQINSIFFNAMDICLLDPLWSFRLNVSWLRLNEAAECLMDGDCL